MNQTFHQEIKEIIGSVAVLAEACNLEVYSFNFNVGDKKVYFTVEEDESLEE